MKGGILEKINIAFVCVHNSCRSQMAEALAKELCSDMFNSFSAGTEIANNINQDAVRIIKSMYNIDMSNNYSKLTTDLPKIDILITMGCNVDCPNIPCTFREDWGLDDPSTMEDIVFKLTAKLIEEKLKNLCFRIPSLDL